MLRSTLLIELRATAPAGDTCPAMLLCGGDPLHSYTFSPELQPTLRYRTIIYKCTTILRCTPLFSPSRFTKFTHVCQYDWRNAILAFCRKKHRHCRMPPQCSPVKRIATKVPRRAAGHGLRAMWYDHRCRPSRQRLHLSRAWCSTCATASSCRLPHRVAYASTTSSWLPTVGQAALMVASPQIP